jgi:hypothetical protein
LTDVDESENELRDVLDSAVGAAERNLSSLTEIQVRKSRFAAMTLTSCKVPVTESGGVGVFRLIFRRHLEPGSAAAEPPGEPTHRSQGLYLSIPLNPD